MFHSSATQLVALLLGALYNSPLPHSRADTHICITKMILMSFCMYMWKNVFIDPLSNTRVLILTNTFDYHAII